jgi:hypothetical protein
MIEGIKTACIGCKKAGCSFATIRNFNYNIMKYKILLVLFTFMSGTALQAQEYWNTTPRVGANGVMEIGKYVDFHESSSDPNDYAVRLYSNQRVLHSSHSMNINGNLNATRMLVNKPNRTSDWNQIWQSGFFESIDGANVPEGGWFWGINFNHASNNENYRYNGQLIIKNQSTSPTMYFRSTSREGTGTWTKVLHSKGNQHIDGALGIATTNTSGFALSVGGKIRAEEVKVYAGWADFVFAEDYVLPPLEDVEKHIKEHNHLPAIPSEAEVLENGIELGEMNAKLLQKIEELTLYTIEQEKRIQQQQEQIKLQQTELTGQKMYVEQKNQEIQALKAEQETIKILLQELISNK